jgi:hypothetical protein
MNLEPLRELAKRQREALAKQPPVTYEQMKAQVQRVAERGKVKNENKQEGEAPTKATEEQ